MGCLFYPHRISPKVPNLRPGVMAQARPATFARAVDAKNSVAALLLLE
jgi:hypothetical protein